MTREIRPNVAAGYILVQIVGAIAGAMLANAMFDLDVVAMSTTVRAGFPKLLSGRSASSAS